MNRDLARQKGLNEAEVRETAAAAVSEMPHIARVYTRDQLLGGEVGGDPLGRRVLNGFYPQRAGDLFTWITAGELHVRIDTTFPLKEAAEAHRYLEGRKTKGKVLLIP